MKLNRIIFIAIVVVAATFLYKSVTFKGSLESLPTLIDVETLASNENNSGADCYSDYKLVDVEYQECWIAGSYVEATYRMILNYYCQGKGSTSCKKGYYYVYYSCTTGYIGNTDATYSSNCNM